MDLAIDNAKNARCLTFMANRRGFSRRRGSV